MSEPSQPSPPGAPVPPIEPPAPPAPPAPPVPPAPQYGEYAPAGFVSPAQVPAQPAPGYESAAFAQQAARPGVRPRKTWDLVLTIILFVLGFFGAGAGVIYGAVVSDPELLDTAFKQQGYSGFDGDPGSAPAVLIISHAVLYLIALGGGIALLLQRRVAFWLPLAIGVIAAVIFWSALIGVVLSDPNLVSQLS